MYSLSKEQVLELLNKKTLTVSKNEPEYGTPTSGERIEETDVVILREAIIEFIGIALMKY